MPGIASALLASAAPGEEMTCRAQNRPFATGAGAEEERGVVSFYALQALAVAQTTEDWSQRTTALCRADVEAGRLPASFAFSTIAVHGDLGRLPGAPEIR